MPITARGESQKLKTQAENLYTKKNICVTLSDVRWLHADDHDIKNEEMNKFASKFDFTGGHGRNGLLWTAGWLPSLPGSKFLLVVLFLLLSFWGDFKGNALPGNYLVVIITGQGLNVFLPVLGVGSFGSKNLGRYSSMWAVQCKFPHSYIQSHIHEKSCLERYIHQVTKIVHLIFKHL